MSQCERISGGPDKFDLVVALFTGRRVWFRLESKPDGEKLVVIITSIMLEEALPEVHMVPMEGRYDHLIIGGYFVLPCKEGEAFKYQDFKGFYNPGPAYKNGYLDIEDSVTVGDLTGTSNDGGFSSYLGE